MKIKYKLSFLAFLLFFAIIPNVFAKEIKVYGGVENVYNTLGPSDAHFDMATNTLTLDNYNNGYIDFIDFDEETINIVLKGDNFITSETESEENALGESTYGRLNLNVTGEEGSTLTMKNYNNGIYVYSGNITVSNVDIRTENLGYTALYILDAPEDVLTIKDSKISIKNTSYPIANDYGKIVMDNVDYTSYNTKNYDFYADAPISISNSKISSKKDEPSSAYLTFGYGVSFDNTTIEMEKATGIYDYGDTIIKNSNATLTDGYTLLYSDGTATITDSTLKLINGECAFDVDGAMLLKDSTVIADNPMYETFYVGGDLEITGGKVEINCDRTECYNPIMSYGDLLTLNTNMTIKYENPVNSLFPSLILANSLIINGGKYDLNGVDAGILATIALQITGGNIAIESRDYPGIIAAAVEELSFDDVIRIENVELQEKDVLKKYTYLDILDAYIYSYFTEEPGNTYSDPLEIGAIGAHSLHVGNFYKVSFDKNGGTGSMEDIVTGEKITLPKNTFKPAKNYKFVGWSLTKDGKKIITSLTPEANVTVYAIWEKTTTSTPKKTNTTTKKNNNVTPVIEEEPIIEEEPKIEEPIIIEEPQEIEEPKIEEPVKREEPKVEETEKEESTFNIWPYIIGGIVLLGLVVIVTKSLNKKN